MTSVTLEQALASFELSALADGVSSKTVVWYLWLLAESPHACVPWLSRQGLTRVPAISTDHLRQYIAWLRAQPNTFRV